MGGAERHLPGFAVSITWALLKGQNANQEDAFMA